jgi:hypothetical protein
VEFLPSKKTAFGGNKRLHDGVPPVIESDIRRRAACSRRRPFKTSRVKTEACQTQAIWRLRTKAKSSDGSARSTLQSQTASGTGCLAGGKIRSRFTRLRGGGTRLSAGRGRRSSGPYGRRCGPCASEYSRLLPWRDLFRSCAARPNPGARCSLRTGDRLAIPLALKVIVNAHSKPRE